MPNNDQDPHRRLMDLQEAVVRLTVIQEHHASEMSELKAQHVKLLDIVAKDKYENTLFRARIGGIVIATTVIVSAVWGIFLAAISFYKH